ncbi:hypothetical protein GCM10010975_00080 [Comamonas phosphati]|nr:hypothetical protein GCM10010975_00080 [Comamonas phosphati]
MDGLLTDQDKDGRGHLLVGGRGAPLSLGIAIKHGKPPQRRPKRLCADTGNRGAQPLHISVCCCLPERGSQSRPGPSAAHQFTEAPDSYHCLIMLRSSSVSEPGLPKGILRNWTTCW